MIFSDCNDDSTRESAYQLIKGMVAANFDPRDTRDLMEHSRRYEHIPVQLVGSDNSPLPEGSPDIDATRLMWDLGDGSAVVLCLPQFVNGHWAGQPTVLVTEDTLPLEVDELFRELFQTLPSAS